MINLRIGFLASHGGSNMQAIIDAVKSGKLTGVSIGCVISNNSNSLALDRARTECIPAFHISTSNFPDENDLSRAIIDTLDECDVDTIILAGYMKKLSPEVIEHVHGRVLNIHPALLPKFGGHGMYGGRVHQAVITARETISGATIHLVDEHFDNGRILAQKTVPVCPEDTPDTLAIRVLGVEHILYTETLQKIVNEEIVL
jgi:phosphoribosylglycinamide formyltransferase-1